MHFTLSSILITTTKTNRPQKQKQTKWIEIHQSAHMNVYPSTILCFLAFPIWYWWQWKMQSMIEQWTSEFNLLPLWKKIVLTESPFTAIYCNHTYHGCLVRHKQKFIPSSSSCLQSVNIMVETLGCDVQLMAMV